MAKNKTALRRRMPDVEAMRATIKADSIKEPKKFRNSTVHHAGRTKATGNVEVKIRSQFPNSDDNPKRPPAGTILRGDEIEIQSRKVIVDEPKNKDERHTATASKGVRFFGKLRRSK